MVSSYLHDLERQARLKRAMHGVAVKGKAGRYARDLKKGYTTTTTVSAKYSVVLFLSSQRTYGVVYSVPYAMLIKVYKYILQSNI